MVLLRCEIDSAALSAAFCHFCARDTIASERSTLPVVLCSSLASVSRFFVRAAFAFRTAIKSERSLAASAARRVASAKTLRKAAFTFTVMRKFAEVPPSAAAAAP
eukprot:2296518-Pleurochrysis_carterae.AAC.2